MTAGLVDYHNSPLFAFFTTKGFLRPSEASYMDRAGVKKPLKKHFEGFAV